MPGRIKTPEFTPFLLTFFVNRHKQMNNRKRCTILISNNIKLGLMLIGTLIFLCSYVRSAEATQLKNIRIGEHKTFTRIVFDFQNPVRFREPVIKDRGKLSVVFLDSTITTAMRFQKLRERTRRVHAIKLTQQDSHLTANITLYSPSFRLKHFSLFSPNRVVLDIYWVKTPSVGFLLKKPLPEKRPEKAFEESAVEDKSPSSSFRYGQLQIYLLVVLVGLNVITVIILALLSFNLLRKRHAVDFTDHGGISDSLKTSDKSVFSIDSRIKEELEKYDRS